MRNSMTSIGLLLRAFRRSSVPTMAALDMEALRICAAMEHIKARGNLDGFLAGRNGPDLDCRRRTPWPASFAINCNDVPLENHPVLGARVVGGCEQYHEIGGRCGRCGRGVR